jgi:hypothetical protein
MIILRKIKKGSNVVIDEPLIGDLNGLNKTFTTPNNFKSDRISIYYNGQKLTSVYDFEITGTNEIELIYLFPGDKDILTATYEMA